MSVIGEIEAHMLQRARDHFGATLRQVDSLPASWDEDTALRQLIDAPALFLSFGISKKEGSEHQPEVLGLWEWTLATGHARELQRRHGDAVEIGAYELLQHVIPLFHGHTVPGYGTLHLEGAGNQFSSGNEKKGLTVYSVLFSMPMTFSLQPPGSNDLDDFITFHADYDLAPADDQLEASDTVILPQDAP